MVFKLAYALARLSNYTSDNRRERTADDEYNSVVQGVYRECLSTLKAFSGLFDYSVCDNETVLVCPINEDYIVGKYLKWFNEYAEDMGGLDNIRRYAFCDAIYICRVLHQAIGMEEKL